MPYGLPVDMKAMQELGIISASAIAKCGLTSQLVRLDKHINGTDLHRTNTPAASDH